MEGTKTVTNNNLISNWDHQLKACSRKMKITWPKEKEKHVQPMGIGSTSLFIKEVQIKAKSRFILPKSEWHYLNEDMANSVKKIN